MVYLPLFTYIYRYLPTFTIKSTVHVGKYTIRGSYGKASMFQESQILRGGMFFIF